MAGSLPSKSCQYRPLADLGAAVRIAKQLGAGFRLVPRLQVPAVQTPPSPQGVPLIKHTATSHLSVRVAPDSGSFTFQDETLPESASRHWVFELIRGTQAEALAVAKAICVTPVVSLK